MMLYGAPRQASILATDLRAEARHAADRRRSRVEPTSAGSTSVDRQGAAGGIARAIRAGASLGAIFRPLRHLGRPTS
jgi:hypothetical protein